MLSGTYPLLVRCRAWGPGNFTDKIWMIPPAATESKVRSVRPLSRLTNHLSISNFFAGGVKTGPSCLPLYDSLGFCAPSPPSPDVKRTTLKSRTQERARRTEPPTHERTNIMSAIQAFSKWLHLKQYQIEVTFSVYIFTPLEKFIFCTCLLCSTDLLFSPFLFA